MSLNFCCAESKVVRIAGDVLVPVRAADPDAGGGLGDPAAVGGGVVGGGGGRHNPAVHHPLDGGGGVGVGGEALQAQGVVDLGGVRPRDGQRVRGN